MSQIFFFAQIQNNVPLIEDSFKVLCDSDLKIEELDSVVEKIPLNKSPRTDGLTNIYFLNVWGGNLLFCALKEGFEKKELIESMNQGFDYIDSKSWYR